MRDDGAGHGFTSILLGCNGANSQGVGWTSNTCRGRIRIYGATGSQIGAYED